MPDWSVARIVCLKLGIDRLILREGIFSRSGMCIAGVLSLGFPWILSSDT
jgi:hypothetical protein